MVIPAGGLVIGIGNRYDLLQDEKWNSSWVCMCAYHNSISILPAHTCVGNLGNWLNSRSTKHTKSVLHEIEPSAFAVQLFGDNGDTVGYLGALFASSMPIKQAIIWETTSQKLVESMGFRQTRYGRCERPGCKSYKMQVVQLHNSSYYCLPDYQAAKNGMFKS